jgi:hypothetical protein
MRGRNLIFPTFGLRFAAGGVMSDHRLSAWPILFDLAIEIFDHFRQAQGFAPDWSFGGGTALMLQIDHREKP